MRPGIRRWLSFGRPSPDRRRQAQTCPEQHATSTLDDNVEPRAIVAAEADPVGEPSALIATLRTSNDELARRLQSAEERADASATSRDEVTHLHELAAALRSRNDALEDRARLLTTSVVTLREKNEVQRNQLEVLKQRLETIKERLRLADQRVAEERSRREVLVLRNSEIKGQLTVMRELAAERRTKLLKSLAGTRERLVTTSALWGNARRYFTVFRQGLFYDEIEKGDVDLRADTYLCLLPSTVPAGRVLSGKHGGRVICDCVENVEVHRHSLAPNVHPPALELVNLTAYGALTMCDGLMTVSRSVARTLERFGPPVRVQPNYRRFEVPTGVGRLREMCGLGPEATVLITSGNVVEGFHAVLDAIALLPPNVHLAALVRLNPPSYDLLVRRHIARLGLTHRVHLLGFVPYEELAGLLAEADLGLITLDPGNPNHSVSLPNRVFDFVTAGLPFVAPPLVEIEEFVREHGCGTTITDVSAEAWAVAINQVLRNLPATRDAAVTARSKVTWESLEDGLYEFLGSPTTLTMLGFRDLTRYQRFLRVADSLSRRGVRVKAAFFSEDPLPVGIEHAEFYHFTDRYGRGPGLVRVAHERD